MPVPDPARAGLDEVLARAVGKVDFDEEKAVTWTVFSHLLQTAEAKPCWALLGEAGPPWPSALMWGGEALGDQAEYAREQLLAKSPGWAPDVLLESWPAGLVIVVARHLKPNLELHDPTPWKPLLESEALDAETAQLSGRLELARAWHLGWTLAERRRFTLVNLIGMPERIHQKAATDLFVSSLRTREDREWKQMTWRQLLAGYPAPWPEWFTHFVGEKRLK
jgi:hypothetical protein